MLHPSHMPSANQLSSRSQQFIKQSLINKSRLPRPFTSIMRSASLRPLEGQPSYIQKNGANIRQSLIVSATNKSEPEVRFSLLELEHQDLNPNLQLQPSSSKRSGQAGKAGYQGVPGAYSEMAALRACPEYDPMPCEQFETAFQVR